MRSPEDLLAEAGALVQSEADQEVLLDAAALVDAEWSRVGIALRLLMSDAVTIGLPSGAVSGRVCGGGAGHVRLASATRVHLIPIGAITWIDGLGHGLEVEAGLRQTFAGQLRQLIGEPVEILGAGDHLRAARLVGVGADHVNVRVDDAGPVRLRTIPFTAIDRVTYRSRMDAPRRSPGSAHTSE